MARNWIRMIEQLTRPQVLATVAPAVVTYVMSAVGLSFTEFTLVELDAGSPGILEAAFGVALFTSCYALVPVGMGYAWSVDRELGFMAWLGLGGLLGIPVFILAAMNGHGEAMLVWGGGPGWRSGGVLHWQVFDAKGNATRIKGRGELMPEFSVPAAVATPDGTFVLIY